MTTWTILSYESNGKPGEDGFSERGYAIGQGGAVAVSWKWSDAMHWHAPADSFGERRPLGVHGDGELVTSVDRAHDALSLPIDWTPPTRAELYRRLCLMAMDTVDILEVAHGGAKEGAPRHDPSIPGTAFTAWVYAPNAEAAAAWWEGKR